MGLDCRTMAGQDWNTDCQLWPDMTAGLIDENIDAEGLFDPSARKKMVSDFRYPEHVDSENIKFKIGSAAPSNIF
jgi:hypothetical protein